MKVDLEGFMKIIKEVITEAKKKKEKADKFRKAQPTGYMYDESFDFSAPLGAYNVYRSEGGAAWGPMTGAGPSVEENFGNSMKGLADQKITGLKESAVGILVRQLVAETTDLERSAWDGLRSAGVLLPEAADPNSVWEGAARWYDHMGLGLGSQTSEGISEKKIGFDKLKSKLSHRKGVKDPGALAASIGRKKYGAGGMAAKSAAGKRK